MHAATTSACVTHECRIHLRLRLGLRLRQSLAGRFGLPLRQRLRPLGLRLRPLRRSGRGLQQGRSVCTFKGIVWPAPPVTSSRVLASGTMRQPAPTAGRERVVFSSLLGHP